MYGRCAAIVSALALWNAPAFAQDASPLTRGVEAAEAADFEVAFEALTEAEPLPLTRDERVRLYSTRAMVAFALGREDDARADLARLLVLGANASLPPSAPPQLRETLEALRREGVRPPTLVADARVEDGVARIDASAEGGEDLVRAVRVWVREDEWRAFDRVERPIAAGDELRWYAEVVGPGALRLATDGTREQPNALRVHVEEVLLRAPPPATGSDDGVIWGAIGGAAGAVVVGVAIALGVVLGTTTDGTQLSGPSLE